MEHGVYLSNGNFVRFHRSIERSTEQRVAPIVEFELDELSDPATLLQKLDSFVVEYVWPSRTRDETRPAIDRLNWVGFSVRGYNVEKESFRWRI